MQAQSGSENNLNQMAISEDDHALLEKFHEELSLITMEECISCREKWFDIVKEYASL